MKFKNSFHPYAMVTIVFWSLAYVLTRLTLQFFSAFSLGFLRYLVLCSDMDILDFGSVMPSQASHRLLWV